MVRGVERDGQRIRILGDPGDLDWRAAEKLALSLLHHAHAARDRELHQAGLEPGPTIDEDTA